MQGEDGSDDVGDADGAASQLPQEAPGLQGGHGLLPQGPDARVGAIDGLLTWGEPVPSAAEGDADGTAGVLVTLDAPIDVK